MGAVLNTAKVEKGDNVAIFGLGVIGLCQPLLVQKWRVPIVLSVMISMKVNLNLPNSLVQLIALIQKIRINPFKQLEMTDGGVDGMRSALECCHKGWSESVIIGVAGTGQEISTRPFQLIAGRARRGSAFGGVKGRSELPELVERYMAGAFKLSDFITHTMALEDINKSFDLMHKGESIRTVTYFHK